MKRRYGLLALALLALLLLNLGAQEEPARPASTSQPPSGAAAPVQAQRPGSPALASPVAATQTGSEPPPASWRAMPEALSQQLASEVSDSDLPLAERLANLEGAEASWLGEGESLFRLQGRYALAL